MNKMQRHTFKLTVLAAALTTVYGTALADDDEISQLTKPESNVSVGFGRLSSDRPQLGIYDGMREGDKFYGFLDFDVVKRDEGTGTWMSFAGSNLTLDTREFSAEWLNQGTMGFSFGYSRTPRDNPLTINTSLRGIGSENLLISGSGAGAQFPLVETELGTHRDLTSLGFYRNIMPGLDLNLSFKNDKKEGTRQWGRGGQPEFAVEPIDATTREFDARLNYSTEKLQLSAGYYGSWYDNSNSLVTTTRQTGAGPTTDTIYLSLPLDNQAHQLYLDGGYTFTPTTRATFKMSYTRATQDETIPTTRIAGLSLAGAPTNLDGEINTKQIQLGLTAQPMPKLSVVANLNYHDVDDETPVRRYVQTDGSDAGAVTCDTAGECTDNTPYSFETLTGKVEATYRLPQDMSLIAGIEEKRQDRDIPLSIGTAPGTVDNQRYVPFRSELDERAYRLQLRRSLSETLNGSVAYVHSKRDGSAYSLTEAFPSDYITPLHIADRERDKWRVSLDWMATEKLSLQGNYEKAQDDYGYDSSRPFGLRNGRAMLVSLDASYVMSDDWNLNAWLSHDETDANQLNARWDRVTENYEVDKASHLENVGNSFGFGLRGTVNSRLKIGADMQYTVTTDNYSDIVTTTGPGSLLPDGAAAGGTTARGTVALPNIKNNIGKLNLFAVYAWQKNIDVRFDLIHERWITNDWSWQFSNGTPFVYGATTDGTTVTADPRQITNFVGVRYIYKFQ